MENAAEIASLRQLTTHLRAENARLLRLLDLTPRQATPPSPAQISYFEGPPGRVDHRASPDQKVTFFAALFAARTDLYAFRTRRHVCHLRRPLLVVATGPYVGEGFDCPPLDTLFLVAHKGARTVNCAPRRLTSSTRAASTTGSWFSALCLKSQ